MQPWAQKVMQDRQATQGREDPEAKCLPAGVPRITPYPFKIVQSPEVIVMLFEGNVHSYRQFLLNRAHDKDLDPTWMGDSIASWQGDTLVVDTVNFNDKTWLNGRGAPHTEKLHVIERYSRPDLGHLEAEITMEDPGAFTKPHTFKRTHILSTTWEIHEYVCNEFNVDVDRWSANRASLLLGPGRSLRTLRSEFAHQVDGGAGASNSASSIGVRSEIVLSGEVRAVIGQILHDVVGAPA